MARAASTLCVAWLVVVSPFAWMMRDGLGPDSQETHGVAALIRFATTFQLVWVALGLGAIAVIAFSVRQSA